MSSDQIERLSAKLWQKFQQEARRLDLQTPAGLGQTPAAGETIQAIWLDETFLKIQHELWYLLTAVDQQGGLLYHRLVPNRSKDTIWDFWNEIFQKYPQINFVVTAGWTAYETACKRTQKSLIHVQHLHSGD